ncbi:WecB/TagA/CpsF family glycosyltransferase [Patescibacteria group bacterium]|nr:WecB/TagA/CpsF family glycosyltransferase [Patescibacteria group bacterium]
MLKKELDMVKIATQTLTGTSEKRLLEFLTSRIAQGKKTFVVTPNPEFFVFARHNPWFEAILKKADLAVPDGIGLIWASRFLGQPIKERISGTDLMEKLCRKAAKKKWSVYLLGGEAGVAKKTLVVLKKRYPGLQGWADSGPRIDILGSEAKESIRKINSKKPDLLFVAFGMGKQEKFITDNWGKLKVTLAMGVGGAFDYLSGQVPRAPEWVREAGLEWLFRLFRQPWRWKRQLRLIEFVWLVLKQRFSFKQ